MCQSSCNCTAGATVVDTINCSSSVSGGVCGLFLLRRCSLCDGIVGHAASLTSPWCVQSPTDVPSYQPGCPGAAVLLLCHTCTASGLLVSGRVSGLTLHVTPSILALCVHTFTGQPRSTYGVINPDQHPDFCIKSSAEPSCIRDFTRTLLTSLSQLGRFQASYHG